jgi:hypothetical protein
MFSPRGRIAMSEKERFAALAARGGQIGATRGGEIAHEGRGAADCVEYRKLPEAPLTSGIRDAVPRVLPGGA